VPLFFVKTVQIFLRPPNLTGKPYVYGDITGSQPRILADWPKSRTPQAEKIATFATRLTPHAMENHIKLTPGFHSNYIRQFQVALTNFLIVDREEKLNKRKQRSRRRAHASHDAG
jgi:hypothetical protein